MPSYMQMPHTPISEGLRTGQTDWMPPMVVVEEDEPLSEIIRDLSQIVKWHFANAEEDDRGVFQTRGFACEIVAWRFLTHLSEHELIDYLLSEIPPLLPASNVSSDVEQDHDPRPSSTRTVSNELISERSRLLYEERTIPNKLPKIHRQQEQETSQTWSSRMSNSVDDDPTLAFVGLNALELATVAGAKHFLSQRVVQDIVNGIWAGDIIFWESLSIHTTKRAQVYHPRYDEHVVLLSASKQLI
ncbi:MAG: hypothetical protein LQ350_000183 [Teloschistes chrysophthalmus]|nr:MAG: hypothetical protein LQ350_000183 [Niorma chrysophthalma]